MVKSLAQALLVLSPLPGLLGSGEKGICGLIWLLESPPFLEYV